ncbi:MULTISPECIES: preprotein translocase subunit YajC [Pasteurellaceae]|uniref:Sec translocon accessory complex subunit YajC n=1 Tax=Pasteurella atlantica TaxID=2827233 RepID=A0AAW8CRV5_9PAST|nr:preprotein translocase subunit YajC [Pasteurella atlantica]MBR0573455.1 preprotein translocase subunit YajC [Pasteurella atlantica]MDP8039456.1 preprotein translocase subunit YajC [Pasteurella atlantica]MDP8041547.1 preprotein translocase subunit YajC [Pasteurella atlantica]MDP8043684.1 preprotein translocase subunit YajC [Pasteurella atlantica]MDP8045819.1 preprotein translocase subunit YajC [Pasteurella atlantica]
MGTQGGTMQIILMLVVFGGIFYFMVYRPQAKRQKEQKALLDSLSKGDEVLISGGLMGKITKVADENIVMALNETTEVTIRRDFVVATLPKGSVKSL